MENTTDFSKFKNYDQCPVRLVLNKIGGKWPILILLLLDERNTLRFSQINNSLGDISQKMLSVTLRSLEADGIITRKTYAEVPPRVEYTLSPMGKELMPLLTQLANWAATNFDQVMKNRASLSKKT